ncbi:hypothetical protein [Actinomadura verrucosospora]|uniref:Uncharacterized protein n=1 Tax=Actinomadura verrucosospora TaxID=46165 RepID=A0A7D3VVQ4_ACTVE|nr:hypothetical protein [Actinomadura verrucosospora]QKG24353.1 hypothetical protein ACTIVE_5996 [Actinomadura verrucosospora]
MDGEFSELFSLIDRLADGRRWDGLRALYDRLDDEHARTDPPASQEEVQKDHDLRHALTWIGRLMAERGTPWHAAHIVTREYEESRREARNLHEALAMRRWAELDGHLTHRELRHLVAHSRVLRGSDLSGAAGLDPAVFAGVPFTLQPWERACWRPDWHMRDFSWRGSGGGAMASFPDDGLELSVPIASAGDTLLRAEPIAGIVDSHWIKGPITVHGTAWEAAARVMAADQYGASVDFVNAYPALLAVAGGNAAYGQWSEARGRIAAWRLLARIGGLAEPVDIEALAGVVARLRCVAWRQPDDEIWFVHLAIEDPLSGTTWVLDGQDFD